MSEDAQIKIIVVLSVIVATVAGFCSGRAFQRAYDKEIRRIMCSTEESVFYQLDQDLTEVQQLLNEQYSINKSDGAVQ